jgi:hypothetical protein
MDYVPSKTYCLTEDALWIGSPLVRIPLATRMPILCTTNPYPNADILLEPLGSDGRLLMVGEAGAWIIQSKAALPE